ncbi:MAG: hypothetical protein EOO47_14055 [Flavobacterium sp.]|nr:MAG: hypothetical protein EOO47_14055 [Flavobacterium sp.]
MILVKTESANRETFPLIDVGSIVTWILGHQITRRNVDLIGIKHSLVDRLIIKIKVTALNERIIVFAGRKEKVKELGKVFKKLGQKVAAFHSDLEQKEREAIMLDFKNSKLDVLIGTDVLSRGIDVTGIDLVINFDAPQDPEDYIHRIGRTARAATTGTAITFVNHKDKRKLANIEKLIERQIDRIALPEHLGEAPKESAVDAEKKPYVKKKKFFKKKPKPSVG